MFVRKYHRKSSSMELHTSCTVGIKKASTVAVDNPLTTKQAAFSKPEQRGDTSQPHDRGALTAHIHTYHTHLHPPNSLHMYVCRCVPGLGFSHTIHAQCHMHTNVYLCTHNSHMKNVQASLPSIPTLHTHHTYFTFLEDCTTHMQ